MDLVARLLPLVGVGLGVGLLAGTFGIGGGVLAVPALGVLMGLDQHVAQGTSLATIVPTTALGAYRYARRGYVRWDAALRLGAAALCFGFLGAHVSLALPSRALDIIFAAFVVFLAVRAARGGAPPHAVPPTGARRSGTGEAGVQRRHGPLQIGIGALVGLVAGLLGIGGGSVANPLLVLLCDFPQQVAQGTTLGAIVLSSLSGLFGYVTAGKVDWIAAVALFTGAMATVPVGAAVAHRLPEPTLRRVFAVFLIAITAVEVARAL